MESDYDHTMVWDEGKIIAPVSNYYVRLIRESLEISIDPNTITNRKDGASFPSVYRHTLKT